MGAGFFSTSILSLGGDVAYRALAPKAFDAATHGRNASSLLIMLAYVAVATFVGAYITARLAGRRPIAHALALGVVGLIFNTVITVLAWDAAPVWYHATNLALIVPVAFLAGRLYEMNSQPKAS